MIPVAEITEVAAEAGLLPTTVEKDYVLGWTLFGIAARADLSAWIFKGGTCLKKCYFDTYRFSEDLDFTIPVAARYDAGAIGDGLRAVAAWVGDAVGIEIAADEIDVEASTNKRGQPTFQAKMTYRGPIHLPKQNRQRIRFDLTQDELVATASARRQVFHGYSDVPVPVPEVLCYSLEEILAEKLRALVERKGRARDVYDVVNVGRNFSDQLSVDRTRSAAARKFAFKSLSAPTVAGIFAAIDVAPLEADWSQALRHQLQLVPPVADFVGALRGVLSWILEPTFVVPPLTPAPSQNPNEDPIPRVSFERASSLGRGQPLTAFGRRIPAEAYGQAMERVRFAARNRLLVQLVYDGVARVVEPYSLRMPGTGNLLLYVWEIERGGAPGGGIKAFMVSKLGATQVMSRPFVPRHLVEL
jgi:predicted nucleotidyltransferase component of viral defense system